MPICYTLYVQKTPLSSAKKVSHPPKPGTIRISLTIPEGLLKKVDEAAKQDYTTRSDLIRVALLWYLRPQGRELDQTDPEVILRTLQQRHLHNEVKKMLKD